MQDVPPPLEVVPDPGMSLAASTAVLRADSRRAWWLSAGEGVIFGLVLYVGSFELLGPNGLTGAILGYCLTWLWLCVVRAGRIRRRVKSIWTAPPYRLSVDEKGMLAASDGGTYWRSWDRVSKLIAREEWVGVAFDGLETLAIPQAAFPDAEARGAWLGYVRGHIAAPTESEL
jgi:hypothetical protein